MAKIQVPPGIEVNCDVDDYLWPWQRSTPVVIHHGFCRNATFWRRWIPQIASSRRVYRPEMRGCGRSDPHPGDVEITLDLLLGDVVRVLDTLGLERVHWVGESSGGVLGILLASTYPERVASLVLVNTPVKVLANKAIDYTADAFEKRSLADTFKQFGVGEWCRRTLGQRLDLDHASPEMQEFFVTEMGKTPAGVAIAIHDCIEPIDTLPLLKKLSVPVLLLAGDKKKATAEAQKIMVREIPHVEASTFEGYGNAIGALAPERCAAEAMQLWERIDPTGAAA